MLLFILHVFESTYTATMSFQNLAAMAIQVGAEPMVGVYGILHESFQAVGNLFYRTPYLLFI